MTILKIDSSISGENSVSRVLTRSITDQLAAVSPHATVIERDLVAAPLAHLTGDVLTGANAEAKAEGDATMDQFLASDVIVIGAPMYNFGIPSTLKAWIDRIAVAGKTFRYTDSGPEGLAGGKRVIVASGRGGVYGESNAADFQEAYLRHVFGFLGITDVAFVRAEGVAYSPQHRTDALAAAHASIRAPMREAA